MGVLACRERRNLIRFAKTKYKKEKNKMKRTLSILLVLALAIFSITSCTLLQEYLPGILPGGDNSCTHEYEPTVTAPTCTAAGFTTYTCKLCQDTYTADETAMTEHTYTDGTCSACGAADPDYVAPHEHSFVEGKCECGETDPNYVPPHEHTFVDGKCECGEYDHEHEFEENILYHPELIAPTCCAPGVAVFECTLCDYYYTEESPADPNAHGFWGESEILADANCVTETNGLMKVHCANEGCTAVEEVEISYYDAHIWDVQIEIYATCTTGGEYYAVCTLCGAEEHYENPASGHYNWYLTCGDSGNCLECGVEFTREHDFTWNPATCTEAGYCTNCWSYVGEPAGHKYTVTSTATCTAAGINTYTCSCGDTYTEDAPVADHVDANLDITCDYDGCTKRILPAADSTISLFTAQHMIIISLSNNYYVEGTVTSVEDAKNGKFVITDEAGYTILIYLPVDADGITHANWVSKVLVGDVVRVYGKPVNPTGLNTTEKAVVKSGVLTFISKHPHVFGEPTCLLPGYCECGQDGPVALGHVDEDTNDLCDRCNFNLKLDIETVSTKYNDVKDTDKVDTTAGTALWEGENFNVLLEKGAGVFNTSGTDHMRYYKNNVLTISSTTGKNMVGFTFVASSASYLDELEAFLVAIGVDYTVDGLACTFSVEATDSITFTNTSGKNLRISSIEVIYEK